MLRNRRWDERDDRLTELISKAAILFRRAEFQFRLKDAERFRLRMIALAHVWGKEYDRKQQLNYDI
jgi:hypothetical protein